MVIKRSSAGEIDVLLADLDADDDVRREAAIARLSVIGARAVSGLVDLLHRTTSPRVRVAALQALEPIQDPRALDAAIACLDLPDAAVAAQAVAVIRNHLGSSEGPRAIDCLASMAVDAAQEPARRLAAIEALSDMPERTVHPIWRRLSDDADLLVARRARLALGLEEPAPDPPLVLEAAAAGTLPEDPRALRAAIASGGAAAPLPTLHRVLEVLRRREQDAAEGSRAAGWRGARAAIHLELAQRGSSVALYDLRETVEQATSPLPAELMSALAAIGDRTCLDAITEAYDRAPREPGGQDWWRSTLAHAFHEIVRRERLTERHAAIRRIRSRRPEAAAALLGPPRRARR